MFSYRHGFHAGNHADVLKHFILVQILHHLAAKDKSFWVIDTHGGAGSYALDSGYAAKSAEFETGIARLWGRPDLPAPLEQYLDEVRAVNHDEVLRLYPGSPQIVHQMLRPHDRLRVFEMHPTESRVLTEYFSAAGRGVNVTTGDGFAGLKAVLPPPPRRGLILIDPSYEDKADYDAVVSAMRDGLQRFATGTYMVWYPLVQRAEARQLPQRLKQLVSGDWLNTTLQVKAPSADGIGLHGSGVFVFNPPWKLEATLKEILPVLVEALGQDDQAGYGLDGVQR